MTYDCRQCGATVPQRDFYPDGYGKKRGLCRQCHERNVRRDTRATCYDPSATTETPEC